MINLKPLPFLKAQNEFKINSCKNKIKLLRNEILRVENFLKSYQNNFEANTKKKIEELFDFINKIIQYNYTMAKTLYQQCLKEQKNQIEQKTSELKFLHKELDSFDKKLDNIYNPNNSKEKYIPEPESQITLDNVYNKLSNFINYENELNLFQINISVKDEDKDILFNTLQNICQLDVDFLKMKNGELPTIKELLNKSSTWPCDCGVLDNSNGKIICKGCSKYRSLETYSNLVFNPLLAEKIEIKEFNMRRKHEEKVFQSLAERNMDNLKHAYFFAIDSTVRHAPKTVRKIRYKKVIADVEGSCRNVEFSDALCYDRVGQIKAGQRRMRRLSYGCLIQIKVLRSLAVPQDRMAAEIQARSACSGRQRPLAHGGGQRGRRLGHGSFRRLRGGDGL